MPVVERLAPDAIAVGDRKRKVDPASVERLKESIQKLGLRTPITVRIVDGFVDTDGVVVDGQPVLVAGAHRLEAVKQLGFDKVDCYIFEGDDTLDAQLWEIAENLHRADLTARERAEQIAEWVRLAEQKRQREAEKVAQVGPVSTNGKGGRGNQEGVRAAARELGLKRTTVQRAVKIAGMSDEAKEAAEQAGLSDNQSALERIARADDQVAEVKRIVDERARKRRSEPERVSLEEDVDDEEPEYSSEEDMAFASIINAMDSTTARVRADVILEYASFARRVLGEHGYL